MKRLTATTSLTAIELLKYLTPVKTQNWNLIPLATNFIADVCDARLSELRITHNEESSPPFSRKKPGPNNQS
jgi:hypothetical protein